VRREHFTAEIQRLASGFGHRITAERLAALWRKFQHVSEPALSAAVDDLLTGSRYPGGDELARAIETASEFQRETQRAAEKRAEFGAVDWESKGMPPPRSRFYTAVWRFLWGGDTWPTWSSVEAFVANTAFEDPPEDWRNFIAEAWRQLPPGTPAGGLAANVLPPLPAEAQQ